MPSSVSYLDASSDQKTSSETGVFLAPSSGMGVPGNSVFPLKKNSMTFFGL